MVSFYLYLARNTKFTFRARQFHQRCQAYSSSFSSGMPSPSSSSSSELMRPSPSSSSSSSGMPSPSSSSSSKFASPSPSSSSAPSSMPSPSASTASTNVREASRSANNTKYHLMMNDCLLA